VKKYKLLLIIVSFLLLLSAILSVFANQLVAAAAKQQLKRIFPGSAVTIGKCSLDPMRSLTFSDIEIKIDKTYNLKIEKIKIGYKIFSLLTGNIVDVSVNNSSLIINSLRKNTAELKNLVNLSAPAVFRVKKTTLSKASLKLKTRDLDFNGALSLRFSQEEKSTEHIDLQIDRLKIKGVLLEGGYLKGNLINATADLAIKKLEYADAVISDMHGRARLEGPFLSLDPLTARLFDGHIKGNVKAGIDKNGEFTFFLTCTALNLATFVKDFELSDKFQLTGELNGMIIMNGSAHKIKSLNGDFSTNPSGGVLIIKDTNFLEDMAKKSGQSLDMLVENFKNYRYTIGAMKVSLNEGNLIFDITLEGEAGKRTFNVILHNVL